MAISCDHLFIRHILEFAGKKTLVMQFFQGAGSNLIVMPSFFF